MARPDFEIHSILISLLPMALNVKVKVWLQNREGVENPYFGSGMYRCGEQTEILK
ncbi:MAG: hypothetical protein R3C26_11780 [Calditrichia bacterium]